MRRHDCGDSSCKFAIDRSGQRTNGGCRCMKNADARIEALEEVLRDLVSAAEGVRDFGGPPAGLFSEYCDKMNDEINRAYELLTEVQP